MSRGVGRIYGDGLLKQLQSRSEASFGPLMPIVATSQNQAIDLRINSARHRSRRITKGPTHGGSNRARYFVLKRQNVSQITVVAICPQKFVRLGPHQAGRNSNAVPLMQDRSFENGLNVKLAANLPARPRLSL